VTDLSASLSPLAGGFSGRTFLGEAAGERVVVRLYPPDDRRGMDGPETDAAVMRLVRGLVPVPDVVEVVRGDGRERPGLLVTRWLSATPGDRALHDLGPGRRAALGASMGRIAGTLAGMPTTRAGAFVDPGLGIEPFPAGDLRDWVATHADGLRGWDARELHRLGDLADRAQDLLDTVGRTCLVHSDLNPKNVLVDDGGEVVAVLDWEFAHSGHPFTDLGNVLRFERDPCYADAALAAYVALRGGTPADALDLARAAELWALVELAAREARHTVTDRAEELLRTIVATGDLHAWPSAWPTGS
jgi:aminoglycoside phosphotransferase (APT) family kinase protein